MNIVALRVTDSTNTASLSSIANALQWVVNNHAQYNITVVNLSLSDGNNYAHNWFATTGGAAEQVTNLIGQLRGMNIPVVVATGNSFTGQQGEGFAAIVQGTISVTATDLSGNLLPDAQRLGTSIGGASATVIAAPGEGFTAPSGDNGSSPRSTGRASPPRWSAARSSCSSRSTSSGSAPCRRSIRSSRGSRAASDPIHDPVTGITIGQLDIPKAAALIPTAASAIAPSPSVTSTLQVSTASVAPHAQQHQPPRRPRRSRHRRRRRPRPPTTTAATSADSDAPTPPPTHAPAPAAATSDRRR